jgi:hypothetical protein
MKKVKKLVSKKLKKGIPLMIRAGHTVRLGITKEPMTVHTGLSLFYAMAETFGIPQILNESIRVKQRESGYPESEHILALAANAFCGGDYLEDLEALREDGALKAVIGRVEIPDPTTAADFCRRFYAGHLLQFDRAIGAIFRQVYSRRKEVEAWTIDVDAKVHEVFGEKKQGAAYSYNGIYSLQPFYAFVHQTDELLHAQLRSGNTHPGGKAVPFLRRMKRKIPPQVKTIYLRSDSALYNRAVICFCEEDGWDFTITADQTAPLRAAINNLPEDAWKRDPKRPSIEYAEVFYQPARWKKGYRYLVRREREEEKGNQGAFFERFAYYAVVTNRAGEAQALMEEHDARGTSERRIGQFTREFLSHLPMGNFMANWVYLLCAQLGYNLSLWMRDFALPPSYRRAYMKKLRRRIGFIAAKVLSGGRQIRLMISAAHRWYQDFVRAWEAVWTLRSG